MNFPPGATINFKFSTFSDGLATPLVGGVVYAYKGNDLTQTQNGITLVANFDGITGLNNVNVNTLADPAFYAADFTFQLVLAGGTVAGRNVIGFVVDQFSLVTTVSAPTPAQIDAQLTSTHGAGDWGPIAPAGAFSIIVTVTDGVAPLQDALVRVVEGINSFTAVTNSTGNAAFSLDPGTYVVMVSKDGYQFEPNTRTVEGIQQGTLTEDLLLVQVAAPIEPLPGAPDSGHHPQV